MIEVNLFNIIGIGYLANMIAYDFTPIQPAKRYLISKLPFISSLVDKVLNCSKCIGFWFGLGFFQNIFHAAVAGLTAFLINHLLDRIKLWYQ